MPDQVEEIEEEIIARVSGQDIGNPNPPAFTEIPHEGKKADADSWLRSKNRSYKKRMARQRLVKDSQNRELQNILISRRQR